MTQNNMAPMNGNFIGSDGTVKNLDQLGGGGGGGGGATIKIDGAAVTELDITSDGSGNVEKIGDLNIPTGGSGSIPTLQQVLDNNPTATDAVIDLHDETMGVETVMSGSGLDSISDTTYAETNAMLPGEVFLTDDAGSGYIELSTTPQSDPATRVRYNAWLGDDSEIVDGYEPIICDWVTASLATVPIGAYISKLANINYNVPMVSPWYRWVKFGNGLHLVWLNVTNPPTPANPDYPWNGMNLAQGCYLIDSRKYQAWKLLGNAANEVTEPKWYFKRQTSTPYNYELVFTVPTKYVSLSGITSDSASTTFGAMSDMTAKFAQIQSNTDGIAALEISKADVFNSPDGSTSLGQLVVGDIITGFDLSGVQNSDMTTSPDVLSTYNFSLGKFTMQTRSGAGGIGLTWQSTGGTAWQFISSGYSWMNTDKDDDYAHYDSASKMLTFKQPATLTSFAPQASQTALQADVISGTTVAIDCQRNFEDLAEHEGDVNNPHAVTMAQITAIPLPTDDGNYTLSLTISGGQPTYAWVDAS
jgi:hypothetical protein